MNRHEILTISDQLRNQFQDFSKYIEATLQNSEGKKAQRPLSQTQRPPQMMKSLNKNFRMRPFIQVAEVPMNLTSRVRLLNSDSTKDIQSKTYRQRTNSKILHEGGKSERGGVNSINLRIDPEKFEDRKEEVLNAQMELEKYISGLSLLSELKFDIKLTFDIANSEEEKSTEKSGVGFFYALQKDLKEIQGKEVAGNMEIVESEVVGLIDKYMGYIREIIRATKRNGDNDTGILLEMTWRCAMKLIDSLFKIYYTDISTLTAEHQSTLDLLKISHNLELLKQSESASDLENSYKEETKKLNSQIKELKNEISYLRNSLSEREKKITELTEVDGGFKAMRSMNDLLANLNIVINEARTQKKKHKTTILEISEFIDVANSWTIPAKIVCKATQTAWTVKRNYLALPQYAEPQMSFHKFVKIDPDLGELSLNDVKDVFFMSLKGFGGEKSFIDCFSETVANSNKDVADARRFIYGSCVKIKQGMETWGDLMKNLLGLQKRIPKVIDVIMGKTVETFLKYSKNEESWSEISLDVYFNMIEKGLNCNGKLKEFLYSNVKLDSFELGIEGLKFDSSVRGCFLLRLAFYLEKSKKNLKALLERLNKNPVDGKKAMIPIEVFEFVIKNKIKMQYSTEEIEVIWEYFDSDADGNVNTLRIINAINYGENLKILHAGKVLIEDFLLIIHDFLIEDFSVRIEEMSKLASITSKEELSKLLSLFNINLPEPHLLKVYTQIVLKQDLFEICDTFEMLPSEISKIGTGQLGLKSKLKK